MIKRMSFTGRPAIAMVAILGVIASLGIIAILGTVWAPSASACGGFFCTNVPVDQDAERIIFTQNRNGTVSAYVQIEYTGAAPDFSWILPLPEAIPADAVAVPEDAMEAFRELEAATDPVFIPPPVPECVSLQPTMVVSAMAAFVEVFASGEVGPYGFDVVGSDDPDALVVWLSDNGYRVTAAMEPIIDRYVDEQFVFLAMKLRPDQGVQDIEPVKVTYPSERPMIPLRLTAVAANPDMAVLVWIFADQQATPVNYARMNIANEELIFFGQGGGHNYRQLMGDRADEYGGQAFITEYAAPSRELRIVHPLLRELRDRHPYVTRLNTVISPEEMTVDPVFDYDAQLKDVSNVRDLSDMTGLFACERFDRNTAQTGSGDGAAANPEATPANFPPNRAVPGDTPGPDPPGPPDGDSQGYAAPVEYGIGSLTVGIIIGVAATLLAAGLVYAGIMLGRRNRS